MTIITQEIILKARQWFADNADACIAEVKNGSVKVNDVESYIEWRLESKSNFLDGEYDYCLGFLQRAHFIQTGECVPLLP